VDLQHVPQRTPLVHIRVQVLQTEVLPCLLQYFLRVRVRPHNSNPLERSGEFHILIHRVGGWQFSSLPLVIISKKAMQRRMDTEKKQQSPADDYTFPSLHFMIRPDTKAVICLVLVWLGVFHSSWLPTTLRFLLLSTTRLFQTWATSTNALIGWKLGLEFFLFHQCTIPVSCLFRLAVLVFDLRKVLLAQPIQKSIQSGWTAYYNSEKVQGLLSISAALFSTLRRSCSGKRQNRKHLSHHPTVDTTDKCETQ
jgi:hypothetical protein